MIKTQEFSLQSLPKFKKKPSILLVVAPYYSNITDQLVTGAENVLKEAKVKTDLIEVPGALEIPTAIELASKHFSGFVALGCVIRGETSHYETVSSESARALTCLGTRGVCIGNGILTVENYEQATERANVNNQNKGGGAALATLHLVKIKNKFN